MYDIITFGSATQDVFLELSESEKLLKDIDSVKSFCLPLGGKVLVEEMKSFSGGGGTNVACSLANFGFKTAYFGKIGSDSSGKLVLADLKRFGVSTELCSINKKLPTAISFIISCAKDRTILVYKGACHFLEKKDIKPRKIKKAKWFYLAPFYEKTTEIFSVLIKLALEKNIGIAVNPSAYQIEKNSPDFITALSGADVLFLNEQEAAMLVKGSSSATIADLAKMVSKICSGIVVITRGDKGVFVLAEENFYSAGPYMVSVEDKTGAGDSFAAGFLAGLLEEKDIEYAIRVALVNSAKNISQKGAKSGLLTKSELKILPNLDIIKQRIY